MITSSAFANKKFAILGLARSGLAVVEALAASGAELVAWDNREEARDAVAGKATITDLLEHDLTGFDGIVVSPGVPLNRHPITAKAKAENVPIIGDIELFSMARDALPPHKVVGITGTNGKSTTTALVHHILNEAGIPTLMGGNIGLPIMSQPPLPEGGVYVLELSSYQIDLSHALDCDVALLLNISPDHLDRYDGFEGYAASKAKLFEMQGVGHLALFGSDDAPSKLIADAVAACGREGDIRRLATAKLSDQAKWPALQGPHNLQNAVAAVAIVEALGVSEDQWQAAMVSFPGLAHRMERVVEQDGVLFVNDSKATNPASTAPALAAYDKIHWIVGGLPKSDNLDECRPNFGNVVAAYTIGDAGPVYGDLLKPYMHVEACEMMVTAVKRAIAAAKPGEVVLLSPACASFDQFKDFESRGECFRKSVHALLALRSADAEVSV